MDANPNSPATDTPAPISPEIQEAWQNLERLNDKAIEFIRERPGTCLIGAMALGYVVGRIALRS